MKRTFYAPALLSLLAGTASAAVVVQEDGSTLKVDGVGFTYLYSVSNGDQSNLDNANSWLYLPNGRTSGDMQGPTGNYYPTSSENVFVGYEYNAQTGEFTPGDSVRKFAITTTADDIYLAGPITFAGGDVTQDIAYHMAAGTQVTIAGAIGLKGSQTTWDYGTLKGAGMLPLVNQTSGACWGANNYKFTGVLTMETEELQRDIYKGGFIDGSRNYINDFSLIDLTGRSMVNKGFVSGLDALEVGEFGIVHSGNTFTLVAKSIPEPATVTLSLLALAGLAARRRRR